MIQEKSHKIQSLFRSALRKPLSLEKTVQRIPSVRVCTIGGSAGLDQQLDHGAWSRHGGLMQGVEPVVVGEGDVGTLGKQKARDCNMTPVSGTMKGRHAGIVFGIDIGSVSEHEVHGLRVRIVGGKD